MSSSSKRQQFSNARLSSYWSSRQTTHVRGNIVTTLTAKRIKIFGSTRTVCREWTRKEWKPDSSSISLAPQFQQFQPYRTEGPRRPLCTVEEGRRHWKFWNYTWQSWANKQYSEHVFRTVQEVKIDTPKILYFPETGTPAHRIQLVWDIQGEKRTEDVTNKKSKNGWKYVVESQETTEQHIHRKRLTLFDIYY